MAGRAVCWLVGSGATLVITFDPFVASFPFVIGMDYTCYRCHHEPELRLVA